MATMDRLWRPLLAQCFGDVTLPAPLLSSPVCQQFSTLALSKCSSCSSALLRNKLWNDIVWTRYPNAHSCDFCGSLHCAKCHCRCRCLNLECKAAITIQVIVCDDCHGWAHRHCGEAGRCGNCESWFCLSCGDFKSCLECRGRLRDCELEECMCGRCAWSEDY